MMDPRDESLAALADTDPEAVLVAVAKVFRTLPSDTNPAVTLKLAREIALEENLNILRLMREHPETTRELIDVEPTLTDELVETFDEFAEQSE